MTNAEAERVEINLHNHVVISVFEHCARCDGAHENLNFERLEPPMDVSGVMFTHWALCPTNHTPILLKVDTLSA